LVPIATGPQGEARMRPAPPAASAAALAPAAARAELATT
jgi:hypothetical protein